MPLMAYEQPLLTVVPAVELVKVWGRADMGRYERSDHQFPTGNCRRDRPHGVSSVGMCL
jgi:hypothetical protein